MSCTGSRGGMVGRGAGADRHRAAAAVAVPAVAGGDRAAAVAAMAAFLAMLGNAWPVALAFAAGLAVVCSSSLAVVMLVLSLGTDPALTVVLCWGANLGGASRWRPPGRGAGAIWGT